MLHDVARNHASTLTRCYRYSKHSMLQTPCILQLQVSSPSNIRLALCCPGPRYCRAKDIHPSTTRPVSIMQSCDHDQRSQLYLTRSTSSQSHTWDADPRPWPADLNLVPILSQGGHALWVLVTALLHLTDDFTGFAQALHHLLTLFPSSNRVI